MTSITYTVYDNFPLTSNQSCIISVTGSPTEAAQDLTAALSPYLDPDSELFATQPTLLYIKCDKTPEAEERSFLVDYITHTVLSMSDGWWVDAVGECWIAINVKMREDFGPSASYRAEEEDVAVAVFWIDKDTLVLASIRDLSRPPTGIAHVCVGHWHPDSRTSGWYSDFYALLDDHLALGVRLADEEGYFVTFERYDASSPSTKARALNDAVLNWDLFGAESSLLSAYFAGFRGGIIDYLEGDNPGYEIEEIDVSISEEDTKSELQALNPQPTPHKARELLDRFNLAHLANADTDHYPDIDTEQDYFDALRRIAAQ